jgi:hypothetical protein
MKNNVFKFALMVFALGFIVEFTAQTSIGDYGEDHSVIVENDSSATAQNIDQIVDEIIEHIDQRPATNSAREWAGWVFGAIFLVFHLFSWIMGRISRATEAKRE